MADSRAQAWSNTVFKSSVLFSNNLWRIKGDCKPVIKSSLILSSRYCVAVTLWKLQSLLRVSEHRGIRQVFYEAAGGGVARI